MNLNERLKNSIWASYLGEDLKELLYESIKILESVSNWEHKFHDYSFVVFPASKAYEGFLKKLFLDLGFITESDYVSDHFRIGKTLNPSFRNERDGIYGKIMNYCGGEDLAETLWSTWKTCRNLLFHWFPSEKNAIDLEEAREKIVLIFNSIDRAFSECKVVKKT